MFPQKREPFFQRDKITLDMVKELKPSAALIDFIGRLQPGTFEIYHEKERSMTGNWREGIRVVHFINGIEEKWYDTFHTWYGLGASMS